MKARGTSSNQSMKLFRGAVQTYLHPRFGLITSKWPRKRGPGGTPAQLVARDNFAIASLWTAGSIPADVYSSQYFAQDTAFLPRDLREMAMFGKLLTWVTTDGTYWGGWRAVATNIQSSLDTITSDAGALLTRASTGWIGLDSAALNYVLTSQGPGQPPIWAPRSGGVGGSAYWSTFFPPDATTFPTLLGPLTKTIGVNANGISLVSSWPPTGTDNVSLAVMSMPVALASVWSATAFIVGPAFFNTTGWAGVVIYNSAQGKFAGLAFDRYRQFVQRLFYNSFTHYDGGDTLQTWCLESAWLRIRCDGTKLYWDASIDGFTWQNVEQDNLSGFYLSAATHVGVAQSLGTGVPSTWRSAPTSSILVPSWIFTH